MLLLPKCCVCTGLPAARVMEAGMWRHVEVRVTSGTPGIELRKSQKGKLRPGPWFIGGVGMRTKDNSCKRQYGARLEVKVHRAS